MGDRYQQALWITSGARPGSKSGSYPHIHSPLLLGESKSKSKDPLASSRPHQEQADELVRAWWLEQHPRPAQKFIAIRKVVEACLEADWPPELIREAMDNVPTISARWLEGYVNRHKRARPQTHNDRNQATFQRAIDRIEREEARGQASSSDGLGPVAGELGTH